jgi:hypothetical protein
MANDRIVVFDSSTGKKTALPAGADGTTVIVQSGVWVIAPAAATTQRTFAFFMG